mgnify:CR=1 FL=1
MKLRRMIAQLGCATLVAFVIARKSDAEGLAEMTVLKAGEREQVFLFDLVPVSRCMFGDYDLILNDLQNARGDLALKLTVEAIGETSPIEWQGEPLAEKTDDKNVGTYRVTLPLPGKSRVLGVFLCSLGVDQDPNTPCSQQSMARFVEAFSPYYADSGGIKRADYVPKPYRDPRVVTPKLYYAQFLAMSNSKIAAFTQAPSHDHAAALKLFGLNAGTLGDVLPETGRFSETLSSLPILSKHGRLQIELPFFDQRRCNGTE